MPIYEYEPIDRDCLICDNRLELLQSINGDSSKIDMNNKKTESSLQMMRQDVKLAKTSVESLKMNFERFVERFDKLEVNT